MCTNGVPVPAARVAQLSVVWQWCAARGQMAWLQKVLRGAACIVGEGGMGMTGCRAGGSVCL